MSQFSLDSSYFSNISSIAKISPTYMNKVFTFSINESFSIELPEVVAVSVSSTVTKMLGVDQTLDKLSIFIHSKFDMKSSLEKIKRVLVSRETVSLDDNDRTIFGEFGVAIGNNDFSRPAFEKINEESKALTTENVLNILVGKMRFGLREITEEKKFIANNFEAMLKDEKFVSFASDPENMDILEGIISDNGISLETEDSLLLFLISICEKDKNNTTFFHLFEYVLIEYCSTEACNEFINFVSDIVKIPGIRSLITCIGRRFIQKSLPMKPNFVEGRHSHKIEERNDYKIEPPTKGIIHSLIEKYGKNPVDSGCIELTADGFTNNPYSRYTKHFGGNVKCIFDYNSNLGYYDGNKINSSIIFDFKDNKCSVKSYEIKFGIKDNDYSRDFVIEGSNDKQKWVNIDNRNPNKSYTESFVSEKFTSNGDSETLFRYIKLRVTDCWGSCCYLGLTSIEFFGDFE